MLCQFAIDDLEDLEAQGLRPTPADIVRLNALGLQLAATKNKRAATALEHLPRVARLNDRLYLRQPTVGHEIWFDRVDDLLDGSYDTLVAVRAYALSRQSSELPDPCSANTVQAAVSAFGDEFADLTREQVVAALDYVIFGASPKAGEYPAHPKRGDDERVPDGTEGEDWKECISLGVLNEGKVVLFGMNQREMESMTRRQLEEAIRRAYIFHHMEVSDGIEQATANYYMTLDEIKERLTKERESNG